MDEFDAMLGIPPRQCCRCGESKSASPEYWYYAKGRPAGACKECRKAMAREDYAADPGKWNARALRYRTDNPDAYQASARRTWEKNRDEINEKQRQNYADNREDRAAQERARRAANPEHFRRLDRERRLRNRDEILARERVRRSDPEIRKKLAAQMRADRAADPDRFRAYDAKRYATPKGNLDRRVSASIAQALRKRGLIKTLEKVKLTGWTIDELLAHLTPLFDPGMSFENYGDWEIDHIIPLSLVEYTSEDDPRFKAVWALSNLAPLWASDNSSKHNRLDWVLPDSYENPLLRQMYENPDHELLAA